MVLVLGYFTFYITYIEDNPSENNLQAGFFKGNTTDILLRVLILILSVYFAVADVLYCIFSLKGQMLNCRTLANKAFNFCLMSINLWVVVEQSLGYPNVS